MAIIDVTAMEADVKAILADEASHLEDEMTPDRKERLAGALKAAVKLAMRAQSGEDVKDLQEIVMSVLLDYKAIAAMVLARTAERALARGAEVGAKILGGVARNLLTGAVPGLGTIIGG